ncbi:MAG: hypothetical protein WAU86_01710 [Oricola sp.]
MLELVNLRLDDNLGPGGIELLRRCTVERRRDNSQNDGNRDRDRVAFEEVDDAGEIDEIGKGAVGGSLDLLWNYTHRVHECRNPIAERSLDFRSATWPLVTAIRSRPVPACRIAWSDQRRHTVARRPGMPEPDILPILRLYGSWADSAGTASQSD